jgi:hypothetical protein
VVERLRRVAVLAIAAVFAAACSTSTTPGPAFTSPALPTATPAGQGPAASPSPTATLFGWAALHPPSLDSGYPDDVVADLPVMVAAGNFANGPALWNSADGVTWAKQALPGSAAAVQAVEINGDPPLAVGCVDCPYAVRQGPASSSPDRPRPALWSRLDSSLHLLPEQEAWLDAVTLWSGGTELGGYVGWSVEIAGKGLECGAAAVWASIDSQHWRFSTPVRLPGSERCTELTSLFAWRDGLFAVVGNVISTSADGRHWTELSTFPPSAGVREVAPGGPGLVAIGSVPSQGESLRSDIWTSVDGRQWSAVPDSPDLDAGTLSSVTSLPALNGLLVAAGATSDYEPFVLVSSDGLVWQRAPEPFARGVPSGGLVSITHRGTDIIVLSEHGLLAVGCLGAEPVKPPPGGSLWCPAP